MICTKGMLVTMRRLRWPYRSEGMLMPKAEEIGPFGWLGWRIEICLLGQAYVAKIP